MSRHMHVMVPAWLVMAILMTSGRPAVLAGDEPAGIVIARVADLPAEQLPGEGRRPPGWGDVVQVDGRKVRQVKAGSDAIVRVKPWWGSALRPTEGQYWLVEVTYKDAVTQPIIFSAFGNVQSYAMRTELHRFGGLNDGQWKTARIPLGWDMVMARPETRMAEFSIHSPGGEVAVASIQVARLAREDLDKAAARYNAETREWVARVQAPKRKAPRSEMSPPQKPAGIVAGGKDAIVPYVRPYLQVIYPYSAPQEGEAGKPLKVQMARNEYEPGAFGVYTNAGDLTNVQVRVEGLRHESDDSAKLEVTVRTAEYALVPGKQPATSRPAASQESRSYAIFPQRLWPMYPTSINRGESGWFWLVFKSDPRASKPGIYRGRAVITAEQGQAVLPIEVTVLPIQLLDMRQADLLMGGCVSGLPSRHEMEMMLRYNHNMINLWASGVAPKIIAKEHGDFDLDFTLLDDYMAQARTAGLQANVWFLGGDPYGFPLTLTLARELARQVLGMTVEQYVELVDKDRMNIPPAIVPLYRKWVALVMTHAKEKGWPEPILVPFDEPAKWTQKREGTGEWIKPNFEQACAIIHEAAPGTRVYASIHNAASGMVFLKDIDVFCTNVIDQDPLMGDKVRSQKKVFWQYAMAGRCLPDHGRYMFGFFFNAFDSRGSLCWAYNWGPRMDTSEGESAEYAWYTPLDTIPSPFYEAVREAWDDRRYVETLKKLAGQQNADISAFLAEIAKTAKALRAPGGRDPIKDFWAASKRIEAMDEMRGQVIRKILELDRPADASGR